MPHDRRIQTLFGIDLPILQAPMAGAQGSAMAVAVSEAGGLGALPAALLPMDKLRAELGVIRQRTSKPVNVNFFCHRPAVPDPVLEAGWRARLAPYYPELGIDPAAPIPAANRAPFDDAFCAVVEEFRPEVVSFHFGLPTPELMDQVKATGARVVSSATTADEARWLEDHGADAIIAQGNEAGGHRGIFLTDDIANQPGLFALLPQVVDAVEVPVIAAGGIGDARGIVAAFALGASAVQLGTAYLFTGRPARGLVNRVMREVGPLSADAPAFPTAGGALMPLKAKAEAAGSADFSSLGSGQAAALGREMGAGDLTRQLWTEVLERLRG